MQGDKKERQVNSKSRNFGEQKCREVVACAIDDTRAMMACSKHCTALTGVPSVDLWACIENAAGVLSAQPGVGIVAGHV